MFPELDEINILRCWSIDAYLCLKKIHGDSIVVNSFFLQKSDGNYIVQHGKR